MGISRATVWMIQGNDVRILQTPNRWETWLVKEGSFHALLLSCPLDKREEMATFVRETKKEVGQEWEDIRD